MQFPIRRVSCGAINGLGNPVVVPGQQLESVTRSFFLAMLFCKQKHAPGDALPPVFRPDIELGNFWRARVVTKGTLDLQAKKAGKDSVCFIDDDGFLPVFAQRGTNMFQAGFAGPVEGSVQLSQHFRVVFHC